MRENTALYILNSRNQINRSYPKQLVMQQDRKNDYSDSIIKLKITPEGLTFWYRIITNAFEEAKKEVDLVEAINDIYVFDNILSSFEEIMEQTPVGDTIYLTIDQLHKLLIAMENL